MNSTLREVRPKIDAARAEKDPFRMETIYIFCHCRGAHEKDTA